MPQVILWDGTPGKEWLIFSKPEKVLRISRPEDVYSSLQEIEKNVEKGFHAAGFLAYEAAPGLDKACRTYDLIDLPLFWFGLFKEAEKISHEEMMAGVKDSSFEIGEWQPSISVDEYEDAVNNIKNYLRNGDTYQVNYTLRLKTDFRGNALGLFMRLHNSQRAWNSAFVDTDDFALCSASPELFLSLEGEDLISKPMKGTSKRGLTYEDDKKLAEDLQNSEKNRAENVMIVDMIRNDMGRIAEAGSVHVPSPFDVEKYPTVLQMTSTVACKTSASFADIMKALFPCASITGAPKIRTMQIIKELESEPRGIYTGCIGYFSSGRKARFNVAIRTVKINKSEDTAEYGVGGGIVWDSDAENEYEECCLKAEVLTRKNPEFDILETMLWEKNSGYFLLDEHLNRLYCSAEYFSYKCDIEQIKEQLMMLSEHLGNPLTPRRQGISALQLGKTQSCSFVEGEHPCEPLEGDRYRIRLLVSGKGKFSIEKMPLSDKKLEQPWKLILASEPLKTNNPFLYHKTTNRAVYDYFRQSMPNGCDDIILWNERGEVTESTIANIVIETNGRKKTPPIKCGLLPGIFRGFLLERGAIEEKDITPEDLKRADKIFLINSVRKWTTGIL